MKNSLLSVNISFLSVCIIVTSFWVFENKPVPQFHQSLHPSNAKQTSDSLKFLKDYQSDSKLDTILQIGGKNEVVIQSRINKLAFYILPQKYIYDSSLNNVVIYSTETKLFFKNKSENSTDTIKITPSTFYKILPKDDYQIQQYGILIQPEVKFTTDKNSLKLNYSYSIPFTDLGVAVCAEIDLKSFTVSKIYLVE